MEEQIGFFLCLTRTSFVFIPCPVVKHHRSVCRHLHLKNPCICNIFFRHFRITPSGRKYQALKSRCFFPAYTGFPGCYPYVSLLILIIEDHYDLFRIRKTTIAQALMIVPQKFQESDMPCVCRSYVYESPASPGLLFPRDKFCGYPDL